jgi:hypothetical protein
MISEPGRRILFIGIDDKTGIRRKIVGHPFPHVPDHLPAAVSAVAGR